MIGTVKVYGDRISYEIEDMYVQFRDERLAAEIRPKIEAALPQVYQMQATEIRIWINGHYAARAEWTRADSDRYYAYPACLK
jgi:hypothetical protein